jgi:hypothetical protein
VGLGFQGRAPLGVSDGASFSGDTPLAAGEVEGADGSPVADDAGTRSDAAGGVAEAGVGSGGEEDDGPAADAGWGYSGI